MSISDDDYDGYPSSGDDGPDFRPELGAKDRVGPAGGMYVGEKPKNRAERAMMDPLDRFRQYVDGIARNLNNWDGVDIAEESIDRMLEMAAQLEMVGHKNPTAYIMGFLATNGGRKLRKENLEHVIKKVLPHAEDTSVLPPDIIRYARLWENLK